MSETILLNVPFEEKDEAKALGARWNPQLKSWYIPIGKDADSFAKWLPPEPEASLFIQAIPPVYLAKTFVNCWKCGEFTDVFCFAAAGYIEEGERYEFFSHFSNLADMDERLLTILKTHAPHYTGDYSHQAGAYYFINHCEHCNAKIGDFYMHNEPGGEFCPIDDVQGGAITLYDIKAITKPIDIDASPCMSDPCYTSLFAKRDQI
jgi:hypothetical protein